MVGGHSFKKLLIKNCYTRLSADLLGWCSSLADPGHGVLSADLALGLLLQNVLLIMKPT
jgi:hypothetical protein